MDKLGKKFRLPRCAVDFCKGSGTKVLKTHRNRLIGEALRLCIQHCVEIRG
jgi:hypothetical protein